ncbi:MAG: PhzF family phenazine biosynthesis protein [Pyrinomonadaceae bacterium MAG19_C2-C3]|nr:PhzF family phenazine biosynthesis protein [Pyrinomonadaceae bacterium MAG19_C2-C3]
MPHLRFFQLDVFTKQAFHGNPLAVFPDAESNAENLDGETMQAIAREMNLSETVFVLSASDEGALRRLRIFTPARELPFAGHPVVGTWNLLARPEAGNVVVAPAGGTGTVRVRQQLGIGVLPVEIEFEAGEPVRVVMTQGAFEIRTASISSVMQSDIIASLGLSVDEMDERLPVQVVSTGIPFLIVPIATLDALGRCAVQGGMLGKLYENLGATGCLAFTRGTRDGNASQAHARMFAPADGIAEDPATGSACGALGGYLARHGALNKNTNNVGQAFNFVIEQGDFIGRPSRIEIEVTMSADGRRIECVRVGGSSVVIAEGMLRF